MKIRQFVSVFVLLALAAPSSTPALSVGLNRLPGEILEYRIRWGIIPAGKAALSVVGADDGSIRFRATAESLPALDLIYPVRNFMESTIHPPGITAARYYKKVKEGWGKAREEEVVFDPEAGLARHFKNGKLRREVQVPEGVQDPLSCLYWYRTQDIEQSIPIYLDIADGSKLVRGSVSVLGRERVDTPAGTFDTVIIEPRMEGIGGVFKKSPGARILIWLTDDSWHRPVKLQSEVIIGSFTVELTSIRSGS